MMNEYSKSDTRPQFGNRYLKSSTDVFQHNAWDDVQWDEEQEEAARKKVQENSEVTLSTKDLHKFEEEAGEMWDKFYSIHENKFFKDRHWLFTEFPEIAGETHNCHNSETGATTAAVGDGASVAQPNVENSQLPGSGDGHIDSTHKFPGSTASMRILEVGCGVGNTVFPILETNNDPSLFVYGCDFSKQAIDIVQNNPEYNTNRCYVFVCDITHDEWKVPFPEGSLDVIILIFVLSAIHPDRMPAVIRKLASYLKPGGMILFRDYGRFDMAQLRFKRGRCLGENFYARGDGTRVYFFLEDDVQKLFTSVGLIQKQLHVDRRLQVNRSRLLKMYRVWIQAKFYKPQSV